MMKLTDLPVEVLSRVVCGTEQEDRVACMLVCKALRAAAALPGTWSAATVLRADPSAADFVLTHRVPSLCLARCMLDDAAWLLHELADRGGDFVRELVVRAGVVRRVPRDLFAAVGRHAELRSFEMDVERVERPCEAFVPSLSRLETLAVREHTPDLRQLALWFDGAACARLRDVELHVACSDVMCAVPASRSLVYRSGDDDGTDSYDDVDLRGVTLDLLELDIGFNADVRRLYRHLAKASIKRLVLHVHDDYEECLDMYRPLSRDLEELTFGMCTEDAEIEIDFAMLRDEHPRLKRLVVRHSVQLHNAHHTLGFHNVPSFAEWLRFAPRIDVPATTRVYIQPV